MSTTTPSPPKPSPIMQKFDRIFLKLLGWRYEGEMPPLSKFVLICAPHTSNWDMLFSLRFISAFGIKINWMGKSSLFRFPHGPLVRWLGGVPVYRSKSTNMVQQMVNTFNSREKFVIGILPEGTRYKKDYWHTGFYHIAEEANVPIVLSLLNYERKLGLVGPIIFPSGDIEADLDKIRPFYKDAKGKNPELMSDIKVKHDM